MKQQNIAEKQTVTMNNHYAQLIKQTGISKTGTPYHMSVVIVLIIYSFAYESELLVDIHVNKDMLSAMGYPLSHTTDTQKDKGREKYIKNNRSNNSMPTISGEQYLHQNT